MCTGRQGYLFCISCDTFVWLRILVVVSSDRPSIVRILFVQTILERSSRPHSKPSKESEIGPSTSPCSYASEKELRTQPLVCPRQPDSPGKPPGCSSVKSSQARTTPPYFCPAE